MLKNTFSDLRFNDGKGEKWKINIGPRQGGILSLLLFNFYICTEYVLNTVETKYMYWICTEYVLNFWCTEDIVNHDVRCKIRLIKWNLLSYADYIVIMSPSLKGLHKLIDNIRESIKILVWRLVSKSLIMLKKK